jgi:hypothetical protein
MFAMDTTRERFWAKVSRMSPAECWLWTASQNSMGYGKMLVAGKLQLAHRISWELHIGPVPAGLFVLHRCDTPLCVNPLHLFVGTNADNMRDMKVKGRHWSKTKPWIAAKGDRHGSRTKPECIPRGDRHWMKRTPERIKRGEDNPTTALKGDRLREVVERLILHNETRSSLAREFGISPVTIQRIRRRAGIPRSR